MGVDLVDVATQTNAIKVVMDNTDNREHDSQFDGHIQDNDTTLVILEAAPGASTSLYIKTIHITEGAGAAEVVTIQEDTGGTPATIAILNVAANAHVAINLKSSLKVTANKNLGFKCASAAVVNVVVTGFTAAG